MKPIQIPKFASRLTAEKITAYNAKLATQSTMQQREQTLRRDMEEAKAAVNREPSVQNLDAYISAKGKFDALRDAMPDTLQVNLGEEQLRTVAQAQVRLAEVERRYEQELEASITNPVPQLRNSVSAATNAAVNEARLELFNAQQSVPVINGSERAEFLRSHLESQDGFWESVASDFSAVATRFEKAISDGRKTLASAVSERILSGEDFTVQDYTKPLGAKAAKALEVVKVLESKQRFIHDSQAAIARKIKGSTHGDTLGILSFLNSSPEEVIKSIEARK